MTLDDVDVTAAVVVEFEASAAKIANGKKHNIKKNTVSFMQTPLFKLLLLKYLLDI